MPESKIVSLYANAIHVCYDRNMKTSTIKKNHHCLRNPSTKCWYARTLYEYIYCEVFKNSGPKMAGLNKCRLHHKPTDWREWCGLNEWPPTWHCAALSLAGTGQAPPLLNLCHQHKHLALASSHAVTLHSKEVSKHSEHKETKRGLNQPYLHLPNGGRDVLCCLSIG